MAASDMILDLGDGLTVRHHRESDAAEIARHANNINVKNNLRDRFPHPYTEEDAITWYNLKLQPENMLGTGAWTPEGGSEGPLIPVHYFIAVNDKPVGSIGLDLGSDLYFRGAELGYWLGEELWGKGIMSRVVQAFVPYVWKTFGILIRINVETSDLNVQSQAVVKKAGFLYEGRRANAIYKNGLATAILLWGALRPE